MDEPTAALSGREVERLFATVRQLREHGGCSNYSIFMRGRELFACMEVVDFDGLRRTLAASDASARWEARMAGIMEQGILPETGFHEVLPEVFHLD